MEDLEMWRPRSKEPASGVPEVLGDINQQLSAKGARKPGKGEARSPLASSRGGLEAVTSISEAAAPALASPVAGTRSACEGSPT